MNQNTWMALRQIVDTIQEEHDGCVDEYVKSLSHDEAYYFKRILEIVEDINEISEDLI